MLFNNFAKQSHLDAGMDVMKHHVNEIIHDPAHTHTQLVDITWCWQRLYGRSSLTFDEFDVDGFARYYMYDSMIE